jgi:hypothetical protein
MTTNTSRVRKPLTPEQRAAKRGYDRERYLRLRAERDAAKPPDAIDLLTEAEAAYIAGIVDGEGSIFVGAVGPQRKRSVYPIICVAMTHRPVIEWLATKLDAGTVKNHHSRRNRPGHWKPQYRMGLFGARAQRLCRRLLPLLIVKHEQARLVCEFPCDERRAPGRHLSPEVNQVRYELRDRINALNH